MSENLLALQMKICRRNLILAKRNKDKSLIEKYDNEADLLLKKYNRRHLKLVVSK